MEFKRWKRNSKIGNGVRERITKFDSWKWTSNVRKTGVRELELKFETWYWSSGVSPSPALPLGTAHRQPGRARDSFNPAAPVHRMHDSHGKRSICAIGCPWLATNLPPNKRQRHFETIEHMLISWCSMIGCACLVPILWRLAALRRSGGCPPRLGWRSGRK